MKPSQITIPLNIPAVEVLNVKQNKIGEWHITVQSTSLFIECGICQQQIECKHGSDRMIQLRHLPILGNATYLHIAPKRGKCPYCMHTPTTTQTSDWYQSRSPHTKAYDRYLMRQLKGSTVQDVSATERVGYDAVIGALKRNIPAEINWDEIAELGTVGIDEIATKKGNKSYRAIVTCRQNNGDTHILAILQDRKKKR